MAGGTDALYADPALAGFYDADNGRGPDLDFCARMARDAGAVLDLGCGTGAFLAGIGAAARVGVDPAGAMLEIARARPGGMGVEWIERDARLLRLGRRFDLVTMTGHAFQVFLSEADQRAALATVAAHLAPGGRFVFDSRNPAAREWEDWTPGRSRREVVHPVLGAAEAWDEAAHDAASGIVTYRTHYRIAAGGRHVSAESRIRFTPQARIAELLAEAGLAATRWLGDWQGSPFAPSAPEIIAIGHLA